MTNFTNGPWRWSSEFPTIDGRECLSLLGDRGHGILSCDGMGNSPDNLSNIALIAAAPELYEALQLALAPMAHVPDSMLASCNEGSRIPALGKYSPSDVIKMRAALAKAEGK